jgi:hypothetical protein
MSKRVETGIIIVDCIVCYENCLNMITINTDCLQVGRYYENAKLCFIIDINFYFHCN